MAERGQSPTISTAESGTGYRRGGRRGRSNSGGNSGGGGGRMIGVNLMLAILVAGLVVAGWYIVNQHEMLIAEQTERAKANERILALEDRLRMTDEAMIDSDSDTKEKIGFWESEIRKLWAVSNDRNRKWIKDNQTALANQKKVLGELQSTIKTLKSSVDRHEQGFGQQTAMIDQLASIELQLQQLVRNQQDMVDKVNGATQTLNGMASRVKENEDAIAAIDASRRAVNSRINDLERRITQPPAGP